MNLREPPPPLIFLSLSLCRCAGNLLVAETSYTRNDYFTYTVLFLSLIFAPSGVHLVSYFTGNRVCACWHAATPCDVHSRFERGGGRRRGRPQHGKACLW